MPNDGNSGKRQVQFTSEFKRNIRHLAKKNRHIKSDVQPIIEALEAGEILGVRIQSVGNTVYKVRVKNSNIKKGKRAGYRLIYHLKTKSTIILM